jgi:D-3-phosphoglycerate dehydrogenase
VAAHPAPEPAWRLLALSPLPLEAFTGMFEGLAVEVAVPKERTVDALRVALADAELVLGDWSHQLRLGPDEVEAAPGLAFVQQPSVGYDVIDVDAMAAAGIPVANCAGFNATSVAEWVVGAALDICRALTWADGDTRAGGWAQAGITARGSSELAGQRVGIVGFGAIGQHCARLFGAFGCEVSYWSRRRRDPAEEAGATFRELDDLLATSDLLVVVIALAPATRGLLSAEKLARLPRGARLVNAARGGIVDEAALMAMLEDGRLTAAALDVYATEPLPADSPLRHADRLLLSPHAAGATLQSVPRLIETAVANIGRATTGEPVVNVVNGVDPRVRRR